MLNQGIGAPPLSTALFLPFFTMLLRAVVAQVVQNQPDGAEHVTQETAESVHSFLALQPSGCRMVNPKPSNLRSNTSRGSPSFGLWLPYMYSNQSYIEAKKVV